MHTDAVSLGDQAPRTVLHSMSFSRLTGVFMGVEKGDICQYSLMSPHNLEHVTLGETILETIVSRLQFEIIIQQTPHGGCSMSE